METVLLSGDSAGVRCAISELRAGQVVALPTETVYGLAANALDPAAVSRIYQAKGRPADNPLIVHITGATQADSLAATIPAAAELLMESFWPGPLTIVLPKRVSVPDITTGGRADIGLRAPRNALFQQVLRESELALAAPSANVAGRPSPTTAEHVWHDLNGIIPLIIDGGPCEVGLESTVISLVGDVPRLLRPGGVTLEQVRATIGDVEVDDAVHQRAAPDFVPGAPGMKYQHYSPATPITILSGTPPQIAAYLSDQRDSGGSGDSGTGFRIGMLCFDDDADCFAPLPLVTYGRHDEGAAQARQLFDALHQVDALGVSHVYAQWPATETGVHLAVRNRLLKAAGHRVVRLP